MLTSTGGQRRRTCEENLKALVEDKKYKRNSRGSNGVETRVGVLIEKEWVFKSLRCCREYK